MADLSEVPELEALDLLESLELELDFDFLLELFELELEFVLELLELLELELDFELVLPLCRSGTFCGDIPNSKHQ